MCAIVGKTRKIDQTFFHGEASFFFKNLFIGLLDPKENVLFFAQYVSKDLVKPKNLFLEVCQTRQ